MAEEITPAPRTFDMSRLTPLAYDVIIADVASEFDLRSDKGALKSPQAQYETMTTEELAAMQVGTLAAGDCLLWFWTTWPMLARGDAHIVIRAWGFEPVTGGAWFKRSRVNALPWQGTGYILRSTCEPFLLAKMGAPTYKAQRGNLETFEDVNAIDAKIRQHSRKPDEQYAFIDALLPHAVRGAELFARQRWTQSKIRWDVAGDQAEKFDAA